MIETLAWGTSGVLLGIALLHVYWLLGGRKGHEAAVPHTEERPLFRPSRLATGIVALLAALAAWFVLEWAGIRRGILPSAVLPYGGWTLTAVFLLRAVGDFKWLGLFKSRKGTTFAKWDTLLYSPVCLTIGAGLLAIAWLRTQA